MAKFIKYQGADGEWSWRLKANNGQIICWAESYSSKQAAQDSVDFVRKYSAGASEEDL